MRIHFHPSWLTLSLLIATGVGQQVIAQSYGALAVAQIPTMTTEQVVRNLVERNIERAQALQAFQGTRIYHLQYEGFPGSRSAEMIVDVKYHSPETKEFTVRSATGSKLIIERVFNKLLQSEKEALSRENQSHMALNDENYTFTSAGQENTLDGLLYILSVEPRTKNKFLYRGRIWIDATDFAVVRIEAAPAKNPSFWTKDTRIEHAYTKVGDFWLPASNRSTSITRLGGRAVLTIEYKDYLVTSASARSDSTSTVAGQR